MLANIVDNRTNKYNINIHAVTEHSAHDNSIKGATKFSWDDEKECLCDCLHNSTIKGAVDWANGYNCPVTLYLYDQTNECPGCGEEFNK